MAAVKLAYRLSYRLSKIGDQASRPVDIRGNDQDCPSLGYCFLYDVAQQRLRVFQIGKQHLTESFGCEVLPKPAPPGEQAGVFFRGFEKVLCRSCRFWAALKRQFGPILQGLNPLVSLEPLQDRSRVVQQPVNG